MLQPSDRILEALSYELEQLLPALGAPLTDGSPGRAILNAVNLLRARESGGATLLHGQFADLNEQLTRIAAVGGDRDAVAGVRAMIVDAGNEQGLTALEILWRRALKEVEAIINALMARSDLTREQRADIRRHLVEWEAADLHRQLTDVAHTGMVKPGSTPFDSKNLTAYLRDRFQDPDLAVTFVKPLIGGYGKQTTIFGVEGEALSGEYVIRRDHAGECGISNQCFRVRKEYPVIRAAYSQGFPAPEALWLDTDHLLIPGGDFMVMRRSPGSVSGTVFGADRAFPAGLVDILADTVASLHTLPPLRELGDLTETIRSDSWDMSMRDCTERNLRTWHAAFLAGHHSPSPALMAIYGWMLNNIPDRPGRPVLLHGDFGFHNLLFHEDRVSAVVDWESSHVGDPASDLGYIRETVGDAIDWQAFLARYMAAGGSPIDPATLHFFQVWAHIRNATGSNMLGGGFAAGHSNELKLVSTAYGHFPHFIRTAQALIEAGPE